MINSVILMMFLYSTFVSPTDVQNTTKYQEKIAWGQYVYTEGAYPYYYSIQAAMLGPGEGYVHICGAALIESRLIVTAAHCLVNISDISAFRVLPNYRNTPFMLPGDLIFTIEDYVVHPEAKYATFPKNKYDIAVALLNRPDPRTGITISLPRMPIHRCLPVKMMGFGYTESGDYPYRLKEATVLVLSDEECLDVASIVYYAPINNICTTNNYGSTGCSGDSGGPLVFENPRSNQSFLVGVLASGANPCHRTDITIFVNVLSQLAFIRNAILSLTRDELRSDQLSLEMIQI